MPEGKLFHEKTFLKDHAPLALPKKVISKYNNCHGVWSAVHIMRNVMHFISFSLYGISQIMN
jgi:hypothetical protein